VITKMKVFLKCVKEMTLWNCAEIRCSARVRDREKDEVKLSLYVICLKSREVIRIKN
jgi:hypothetical protein